MRVTFARKLLELNHNVLSLCDVAKFGNAYFLIQINVMRNVNFNLLLTLQ